MTNFWIKHQAFRDLVVVLSWTMKNSFLLAVSTWFLLGVQSGHPRTRPLYCQHTLWKIPGWVHLCTQQGGAGKCELYWNPNECEFLTETYKSVKIEKYNHCTFYGDYACRNNATAPYLFLTESSDLPFTPITYKCRCMGMLGKTSGQ